MERGKKEKKKQQGEKKGINSWFHLGCSYAFYLKRMEADWGKNLDAFPDVPK